MRASTRAVFVKRFFNTYVKRVEIVCKVKPLKGSVAARTGFPCLRVHVRGQGKRIKLLAVSAHDVNGWILQNGMVRSYNSFAFVCPNKFPGLAVYPQSFRVGNKKRILPLVRINLSVLLPERNYVHKPQAVDALSSKENLCSIIPRRRRIGTVVAYEVVKVFRWILIDT